MKDLCNYPRSRIDTKCVFLKKVNNGNCSFCELYPYRNIREHREACDKILP